MAILDSFTSNAATTLGKTGLGGSSNRGGTATLEFPQDLADLNRPIIRFSCTPHDGSKRSDAISLPIPSGIAFSDGATYTTVDMGTIAAVTEVVKAVQGGGLQDGLQAGAEKVTQQIFSGGSIGAGILAARKLGATGVAQTLEFQSKQVVNPRTNTAFSANTLRNFQFDFKLIGKSPSEVNIINDIQNTFRDNLYASELGGEKVMLEYPPIWTVQFMKPDLSRELEHLPKIYTCYMTGFTTTVNQSSNTFRTDHSPYEVDISCQFQETKILTRQEIERLNQAIPDRTNDIDAYISTKVEQLKQAEGQALEALAEQSKAAAEE